MDSKRNIRRHNLCRHDAMEILEQRRMLSTVTANVSINENQTFQTIEGFGAGILQSKLPAEYSDPNFYNLIVDDLGATAARAPLLPLAQKTLNGPFDPTTLAEPFGFFQQLKARGVDKFLTSVWTAPAFMKTNAIFTDGGTLRPDMYGAYANYLDQVTQIAKNNYGVDLYSISVQNEPFFVEPYDSTVYNAQQLKETLRAVGEKFKADGVTTKISVDEDLIDPGRNNYYIKPIMNDPETAGYVGFFAGHALTTHWDELKAFLAPYGKEFWQTETSGNSATWEGGIGVANTILNSIETANASGFLYWQFDDSAANSKFALMSDGVPNTKYYAAKQFFRYIRPGFVHVADTEDYDKLRVTSFKDPKTGALTTVILNTGGDIAQTNFNITGSNLPGTYKVFRSSSSENMVSLGTISGGSNFSLTIPGLSLVTITNAPELPVVSGGALPSNLKALSSSSFVTSNTLYFQAEKGYIDSLTQSIAGGADVNKVAANANGWTLLMSAASSSQSGSILTLQKLIDSGATIDATNNEGWTPLIAAAANSFIKFGSPATMQNDKLAALLNAGADINHKDINGRTALIWAAMTGKISGQSEDPSAVQFLLSKGADATVKDNFGKTALDYAQQMGYVKISAVLNAAQNGDTTKPVAHVVQVSPDPRTTPVDSFTITFSEPVTHFDTSDLLLTDNGVAQDLSTANLSSNDGITWTLGNTTALTTAPGAYTLTVLASAAGITDFAGNPLLSNASDSWTNGTVPPPPPSTQQPFHGTPFQITSSGTTTIEFEDFDTGGEGVAYHDVDSANLGKSYRTSEGVDIQPTTDTGGGFNVGYTKAGEWLEYTVNVATSGTYDLNFRVASTGSNGTFHAEIDGSNVTGTMTVPNTGGYQNWITLTKSSVQLSAGQHILRIAMDGVSTNGSIGNFNWLSITPPNSPPPPPPPPPPPSIQQPFHGAPLEVSSNSTATLQFEDFDTGGEGVAYHDVDSANLGKSYRTSEGVDIQPTTDAGGGFNVGYTKAGEWIEYTTHFDAQSLYTLGFRVATTGSNGKFHLEVDGVNVTGSLTVPNTGGYQTWQTLSIPNVSISAGDHILRLAMDGASTNGSVGNFNYLTISPPNSPPPPPPPSVQQPFLGTPFAVGASGVTIQAEDFDTGGEGVAYHDVDSANLGKSYRTSEGVDIQPTTDNGGGFNVGYTKAGEWMEYTINVATAGNYDFGFRLASTGSNGKFHAEIDGANVTGALTVPSTGGYQTWQTLNKTGVALTAGQHVLRVAMDSVSSNGSVGNFNYVTVKPSGGAPVQTPFLGSPFQVGSTPVTIQTEDFDNGGEGVAYHDTESANLGGSTYRSNVGVDIELTGDTGGGNDVGFTKAGEWLEYTINVATAGVYTFDFRASSKGAGGNFHAEIDGSNVTGSLSVPDTKAWNTFTDVLKTGVSLSAGQHVLRLALESVGGSGFAGNFNWLKLTKTA